MREETGALRTASRTTQFSFDSHYPRSMTEAGIAVQRRLCASAYSLSLMLPRAGFEIIKGSVAPGGLHGDNLYAFCDRCKNWLYTEPSRPDIVIIRSTMLDECGWAAPFIESMTSEKLPWVELPVAYSFKRFPDPSEYAEPLAAFAKAGPRAG